MRNVLWVALTALYPVLVYLGLAHAEPRVLALLLLALALARYLASRSRQALWKKGETSGNMLRVADLRIDCDQDAVWIKAHPAGPACHTGERSCFFRRVTKDGLERADAE